MDKKKSLPKIALLITLIIIISATVLFSRNTKDTLTNIYSISKQEAYDTKKAEHLVMALKYNNAIDDVIINAETNPKQVNIITNATYCLTPEAKEYIEKLINDIYPESTVNVNYSPD